MIGNCFEKKKGALKVLAAKVNYAHIKQRFHIFIAQ